MSYLVLALANSLKKIILAKDSGFNESIKLLIDYWSWFIERTAFPIPGMVAQASFNVPLACSRKWLMKEGLFLKKFGLFPPM